MKILIVPLFIALCCLAACNKSAAPGASSNSEAARSSKPADAVQQKLVEYSGSGATDCGRLDVHAVAEQLKSASDCSLQASQSKRAFYVAYDMPAMTVGVAGNAEGKLFSVQSQGAGSSSALTSGNCPSQLRVAASGRVTCFAPGDMGSMGSSHGAGSMPPGMPNPHAGGAENPHAASPPK